MALAIVGPVVIFSAAALKMLLDSERSAVLRSMHETARSTSLIIDKEIGSAAAAMHVLAASEYLANGDLDRFYRQAVTAVPGDGSWVALLDAEGRQLFNTLVPYGAPIPPGSARERVRQVMATRTMLVSDLFMGAMSKHTVTTVNVPVPVDAGQRYVLATAFTATYLQRAISRASIPEGWVVAVLDRQGRFIARSHNGEGLSGTPAAAGLVRAAAERAEGEVRVATIEGIDSYQVFTHSPLSAWTVAVAVPVAAIEASARHATIVTAFGLLAAVVLATGMAMLLGGLLVSSIDRAARAAAALGRGEKPEPLSSWVSEVNTLQAALVRASQILEADRAALRKIEAERILLLGKEQEARRLAESQNQAKDQFLAMLGHEIRNPLAAISGAVTIMNLDAASPAMASRARAILQRQSENLAHIVDDLLDVARVTTGKVALNMQRLDLAEMVGSCIDALHASGRTRDRLLNAELHPAWIEADRTRAEQVVNNLIGNALKYTGPGARIDIAVHAERNEAWLSVSDSGIGISAQLLPHVFDLFTQGAATLDRAQGGLGIGLTLVRQLVTLHGGEVGASSAGLGHGSRFTVRLPLAGQAAVPSAPAVTAGAQFQPGRVLLIEDNLDSREMMAAMLGLQGYVVLETGNGIDGLQRAAADKPDLAIVDIGLPGMSGLDVARQIRSDPALRHMTLIAMTGYGQESDRRTALEAGFDLHLVKPVDNARLLAALRQFAGQHASSAGMP